MNNFEFLIKTKEITKKLRLFDGLLFYFYIGKYIKGKPRYRINVWKTWPFICVHKLENGFDGAAYLQIVTSIL